MNGVYYFPSGSSTHIGQHVKIACICSKKAQIGQVLVTCDCLLSILLYSILYCIVFGFPICHFLFVNLLFSLCVFVIFNLLFLDCKTAADQLWLVPITLPLSLSSFPQQKRTWSIKEETRCIVQGRVKDDIKGKSQHSHRNIFFPTCILITIPSSGPSLKSNSHTKSMQKC